MKANVKRSNTIKSNIYTCSKSIYVLALKFQLKGKIDQRF